MAVFLNRLITVCLFRRMRGPKVADNNRLALWKLYRAEIG